MYLNGLMAFIILSSLHNKKQEAAKEYSRGAHKEVKKSVKRDKEVFLNEIADKVERAAAAGQQGILYQM